ncbi:hypothetical protein A0256_23850 [Mucilaginibacter sp. PAMC 26640]|nr:hypothetical protein A0256_23850 [Mucilaginibacter sp. PAMC 26640]
MQTYFTLNTITELSCFLIALLCLLNNRKPIWRWFCLFIFITCITEFTGIFLNKASQSNQWLYNGFIIFEIGFITWVFEGLFSQYQKSKMLIILGTIVLTGFYIFESLRHGLLIFHSLTNNAESILFTVYSLYYFYLLLKDDDYTDLKVAPNFWWVAGVLFFYFGSTAVNIYRGIGVVNVKSTDVNSVHGDTAKKPLGIIYNVKTTPVSTTSAKTGIKAPVKAPVKKQRTMKQVAVMYINNMLIIILYGCWTYSFICRRWLIKRSQI